MSDRSSIRRLAQVVAGLTIGLVPLPSSLQGILSCIGPVNLIYITMSVDRFIGIWARYLSEYSYKDKITCQKKDAVITGQVRIRRKLKKIYVYKNREHTLSLVVYKYFFIFCFVFKIKVLLIYNTK